MKEGVGGEAMCMCPRRCPGGEGTTNRECSSARSLSCFMKMDRYFSSVGVTEEVGVVAMLLLLFVSCLDMLLSMESAAPFLWATTVGRRQALHGNQPHAFYFIFNLATIWPMPRQGPSVLHSRWQTYDEVQFRYVCEQLQSVA